MFTGIIEEIGQLRHIRKSGAAMVLTIEANKVLTDVHLGDSIAVNGVCLTVVSFDSHSFSVDVMPETYRKTNLKDLKQGSKVNLERAMSASSRFGGHFVQGHVDGIGTIEEKKIEANAIVFQIKLLDLSLMKYVLPRGSITLDGISLTVVSVSDETFTVSVIPHTLSETVLKDKKQGDTINIECDMLGKYIDRLLDYRMGSEQGNKVTGKRVQASKLTSQFLTENGFM